MIEIYRDTIATSYYRYRVSIMMTGWAYIVSTKCTICDNCLQRSIVSAFSSFQKAMMFIEIHMSKDAKIIIDRVSFDSDLPGDDFIPFDPQDQNEYPLTIMNGKIMYTQRE